MDLIGIKTAISALNKLGANAITKRLIMNSIKNYNQLVQEYNSGSARSEYVAYQKNVLITQLNARIMLAFQQLEDRQVKKGVIPEQEDKFTQMIKTLKQKKRKSIT